MSPALLHQLDARLDAVLTEFKKLDLGYRYGDGELCGPVASDKKTYYPSIYLRDSEDSYDEIPDEGEAVVKYKVTRRSRETVNGKTKHSATLDVMSIETDGEKPKGGKQKTEKGAVAKMLSSLIPHPSSFHQFAPYGERTRDGAGRYIANETGGADPASMRQAYGPPQVVVNTGEKPRSSLKPGLIGAALGAGAMTKRGKRVIGAAGRMAVRGVRAVV